MSLSPRQVESVEQWLDDQPPSANETDVPPTLPSTSRGRVGALKEETTRRNYSRPQSNRPQHHPPPHDRGHDRDLHVHSRLQMHSRLSRRDPESDGDHDPNIDFVDPVECFLRVCSACLGSAALAVGAVTYVLVHRTTSTPLGGTSLDNRLGWVIAVPVAAAALVWQLTRLSLLAWHGRTTSFLVVVDLLAEGTLAVGSVICAILAGFQAARHAAYNTRHRNEVSQYADVGPEIALVVLLALLSMSSLAILALNVVEASRRRRYGRSNRSTSSSVIEIIP
jgi:hypothetical protein